MNHKTQPNCIARDMFAPWTIYIDSRPVESFGTEAAAEDAYRRLLARPVLTEADAAEDLAGKPCPFRRLPRSGVE